MISRNQVEDSLLQSLQQGRIILRCAQGRVHLIMGIVFADILLVEDQVMR